MELSKSQIEKLDLILEKFEKERCQLRSKLKTQRHLLLQVQCLCQVLESENTKLRKQLNMGERKLTRDFGMVTTCTSECDQMQDQLQQFNEKCSKLKSVRSQQEYQNCELGKMSMMCQASQTEMSYSELSERVNSRNSVKVDNSSQTENVLAYQPLKGPVTDQFTQTEEMTIDESFQPSSSTDRICYLPLEMDDVGEHTYARSFRRGLGEEIVGSDQCDETTSESGKPYRCLQKNCNSTFSTRWNQKRHYNLVHSTKTRGSFDDTFSENDALANEFEAQSTTKSKRQKLQKKPKSQEKKYKKRKVSDSSFQENELTPPIQSRRGRKRKKTKKSQQKQEKVPRKIYLYQCSICEISFHLKSLWKKHQRTHDLTASDNFSSSNPNEHHDDYSSNEPNVSANGNRYKCEHCLTGFRLFSEFKKHIQQGHKGVNKNDKDAAVDIAIQSGN